MQLRDSGETFQFHKGAIRTFTVPGTLRRVRRFQFHKGAIRTFSFFVFILCDGHFNSIKVRLERLQAR